MAMNFSLSIADLKKKKKDTLAFIFTKCEIDILEVSRVKK